MVYNYFVIKKNKNQSVQLNSNSRDSEDNSSEIYDYMEYKELLSDNECESEEDLQNKNNNKRKPKKKEKKYNNKESNIDDIESDKDTSTIKNQKKRKILILIEEKIIK